MLLSVIALLILLQIGFFVILYLWILLPLLQYSRDIGSNRALRKHGNIRELRLMAFAYNELMDRRNKLDDFLRRAAETDSLTGLQSRYHFEQVVLNLDKQKGSLGVLFFDVNYLKIVNDTKGYLEGDLLLCQVANAIKDCFGDQTGSNCYRIGGDEFVAILRGCAEEEILKRIDYFRQILDKKGISVSIGYALDEQADEQTFRRLVQKADKWMYENKKHIHSNETKKN